MNDHENDCMNCQAFEAAWQAHFDAESPCPPSDLTDWDTHLCTCSKCVELDSRYRKLRQALQGWSHSSSSLVPFSDSHRHVLQFHDPRDQNRTATARPSGVVRQVGLGLGFAASLAYFVLRTPAPVEVASVRPGPSVVVPAHLAGVKPWLESSSGTGHLIRVASLPATLLGREVLNTAQEPANPRPPVASDRLKQIGGRVISSIQPISNRARGAFDFVVPVREESENGSVPTGRGA